MYNNGISWISSSNTVDLSNDIPEKFKSNTIYDLGELNQNITLPVFDLAEYEECTIMFDVMNDIHIDFASNVIWEDTPNLSNGNHYELHVKKIGNKLFGNIKEYKLLQPKYLTFTAVEDNSSVGFYYWVGPAPVTAPDLGKNMEYSLDNGKTWETYTIVNDYNNINRINLEHVGDSVMFRGNNETLRGEGANSTKCELQGKVAASGDITSLLNGIGGDIPIPESCFAMFFFYEEGLTSAPNLPSTQLGSNCYSNIFNYTSLTEAPELPATRLTEHCYSQMFSHCTSLIKAPALPATTLANNCYANMFSDCTSLTTAPELPAVTLADSCYQYMFNNCTSLTTAPELPATKLASNCYNSMFAGCTSLIAAPELPATSIGSYGGCYNLMFKNCTQLNSVKVALSSIPWDDDNFRFPYTENWLSGVAATGTFKWNGPVPYNGTRNASLIPSGWTVESITDN
jgi:hypothetical protein